MVRFKFVEKKLLLMQKQANKQNQENFLATRHVILPTHTVIRCPVDIINYPFNKIPIKDTSASPSSVLLFCEEQSERVPFQRDCGIRLASVACFECEANA